MTTIAGASGNSVAYNTRTPFGDTLGSGLAGQTQYVARRDADGAWSSLGVTPTPRPDAVQTFLAATKVQFFSDELERAIVYGYDLPGGPGGSPFRNNIYVEDTGTRALQPITVTRVDQLALADFLSLTLWGISADGQHVPFVTSTQLLPEAAPGVPNVYQWDKGVLSVAGVLPNGSVPVGGSDVVPSNYRGAMSKDGNRLAFTASPSGGPSQLYLRIDGSRSVWVSQPEGSDQSDPVNVALQAMTPDGHNVFFVSDSRLLDEDTNFGPDLYRYTDSANPAGDGNLTMITRDGDSTNDSIFGSSVAGISDDGQRVYYHTLSNKLGVWDHGTTTIISALVSRVGARAQLTVTDWGPGLGRVSSDGNYFAFVTDVQLVPEPTNRHSVMYLYSLRDNRIVCASCSSAGATTSATVLPSVSAGPVTVENVALRPRFLSDRGQVFFSTTQALVPEDKNGIADAYEYDGASGTLGLLSTGKGRDPTMFADASASGDDVFLVTRQKLVTADRDDLVDMYDARVGPPLPELPATEAPRCEGEACQPPPSLGPSDEGIGSLGFDEAEPQAPIARAFAVLRHGAVTGAAGTVRIRFLTAGKLAWKGRGLRSSSLTRKRAGTYRIQLRLTKHARAQLRRAGRYVTTVRLTFVQTDGTQARSTTRVAFRAAAKKGR